MMKIRNALLSLLSLLVVVGSCQANLGDVTVSNQNYSLLKSTDKIQFQLITNGNGLIESEVLSAMPPNTRQTLGEYSFSDQTNQFTIYLRNASTQNSFIPCSEPIQYQHHSKPIKIIGWNDGKTSGCRIEE